MNASKINSFESQVGRARVSLEIASEIYAFMGMTKKIFPDDAGEIWTAKGVNYSITFNPSNDNFFVESLHSKMVVQSIDGEIDLYVVHAVTEDDVNSFAEIRKELAPYEFCRSQSPKETQREAWTQWWVAPSSICSNRVIA